MGTRGPKPGTRVGGRQKGSKNKATIEREHGHAELVAAATAEGLTPLEHMLKVLRDPKADDKRRDAMAIAAAQFVHPKLSAVEHSGEMKMSHEQALDEVEAAERAAMNGHEQAH